MTYAKTQMSKYSGESLPQFERTVHPSKTKEIIMPESEIPAHEHATIPATEAAKFLVNEWSSLGFDVASSADCLIDALRPYASPAVSPAPSAPVAAEPEPNHRKLSALSLTPAPVPAAPVSQSPVFPRRLCALCGGTGCRACNSVNA